MKDEISLVGWRPSLVGWRLGSAGKIHTHVICSDVKKTSDRQWNTPLFGSYALRRSSSEKTILQRPPHSHVAGVSVSAGLPIGWKTRGAGLGFFRSPTNEASSQREAPEAGWLAPAPGCLARAGIDVTKMLLIGRFGRCLGSGKRGAFHMFS